VLQIDVKAKIISGIVKRSGDRFTIPISFNFPPKKNPRHLSATGIINPFNLSTIQLINPVPPGLLIGIFIVQNLPVSKESLKTHFHISTSGI
jgi:hypothetical protein